jgi:Ca2+-binding EF-hand superfamily protein
LTIDVCRRLPNVNSAGEFLNAQLTAALGDRSALAVGELKRNATLSGLFELASLADRNGDEVLTQSELTAYTELVAAAVQSQVFVAVTDRAFNLFPFLDGDGDGRLSYIELTRVHLLSESESTTALPRQYQVTFGAAPMRSWGGMMLPAPTAGASKTVTSERSGPRWFQAIDRNADGIVSPREFLASPEAFAKFDANGDGMITVVEAIAHPVRQAR